MQREPWIFFWGACSAPDRKAMLEALARAGVEPRSLDANAPSGEGIVVFSAITDGLCEFLREVNNECRERILAISLSELGAASEDAWRLLRAGASDVLLTGSTSQTATRVKARLDRWRDVDALVHSETVQSCLIGASPTWRSVLRQIVEVSRFTRAAVLLFGESGTGKELIGQVIHSLDTVARGGELVVTDCTTVMPELSGSEFFGHERGAFTGAIASRDGALASADGGTLFLDEVGELPLPMQAQLLRAIQEGTYKRVGSDTWRRSQFRLVCATHRNLLEAVDQGRFRQDLFYRIAGWVFRIPPLNERREDIIPLAKHFFLEFHPGRTTVDFDPAVMEHLVNRLYPGNIRDLRQLMARVSSRYVGPGPVTVGDLPDDERPSLGLAVQTWRGSEFEEAIRHAVSLGVGLREISQAAADTATRIALHLENGNVQAAARSLRVTDRALQMRRAAWRSHHQSH
jgi:transcriptional regulator with GAF, ATPase, and Fis domain